MHGCYPPSQENLENVLDSQLKVVERICTKFKTPLSDVAVEVSECREEYLPLVRYATTYFNVDIDDPLAVWSKLYEISKLSTSRWNNIFKLIELCLCTPYSNASLERFFSHLGVVKNDWRNRMNEENLTDLLRIKVVGLSLEDFDKQGY